MSRDDIQKLLGGYATGTLTEAERKALFDAALHDQKLFDALADEEALRELLSDSYVRAAIRQALEPAPEPSGWGVWLRRPFTWAAAGSMAAAIALLLVMLRPDAAVHKAEVAFERPNEKKASTPAANLTSSVPAPARQPPRKHAAKPAAAKPLAAAPAPKPEADALALRSEALGEAVVVSPPNPMSVVSAFNQTAPVVAMEAAEVRADKARGGLGMATVRRAAAPAAGATAVTPAIRYRLQQRSTAGMYEPVDPDLPLSSPAPLRMEVETNIPAYLYAFEAQAGGGYLQLSVGPTVDAHVRHSIELGEPVPDRRVILVLSVRPQAEFAVGTATEGAVALLSKLRMETAAPLRQKSANSMYVMGRTGAPVLVVEVALPRR